MADLSVVDALEAIENAARGGERLATLKRVDSPELRQYLYHALSPDVTFGMKKLPQQDIECLNKLSDIEWYRRLIGILGLMMADENEERQLSGNAAKRVVVDFIACCTAAQRKWAERVIVQDLRLSIGAKDVNSVLGKDTIPLFAVPLAERHTKVKSIKGTYVLQHKYDGGRCVAQVKPDCTVTLVSRTGKEWKSFPQINAAIAKWAKEMGWKKEIWLDGELIVIDKNGRMDFNAIQKLFHARDGRLPSGTLRYVMFDFATSEEYQNPTQTYQERLHVLTVEAMVGQKLGVFGDPLGVAQDITVIPTHEMMDQVANEYVLKYGCDGAILRRADKVPTNKRTDDIIKWKPFEDGEAVVQGFTEGKGWLEGSLGSLTLQMVKKVGGRPVPYGEPCEMGTGEGWTKELRQELWDMREELPGSYVSLKFQRIGPNGRPLLPTYRAIRHKWDM